MTLRKTLAVALVALFAGTVVPMASASPAISNASPIKSVDIKAGHGGKHHHRHHHFRRHHRGHGHK